MSKAELCPDEPGLHICTTYILFSKKDGQLYTGYTNNLKKRIEEHKSGRALATKFRQPIQLIYESYLRWSDAKRREKYLKGGNGRAALTVQLQDILQELKYRHLD